MSRRPGWREKSRDEVRTLMLQLKDYTEAWEAISKSGRQQCIEAGNALILLREFSDGSRQAYDGGEKNAVNADQAGAAALNALDSKRRQLERLLGGMQLALESLRSISDRHTEGAISRDATVFATLTAGHWESFAEDILDMHISDYFMKAGLIDALTNETTHDRKTLGVLAGLWLTQGNVSERKLSTIFASLEAEIASATALAEAEARRDQPSSSANTSAAVNFLLGTG